VLRSALALFIRGRGAEKRREKEMKGIPVDKKKDVVQRHPNWGRVSLVA
jgi:hypothetical protein